MNNLIDLARHISVPDATLTVAYTPIRLAMDGSQPLELRLIAPASDDTLPIVLLSHGFWPLQLYPVKRRLRSTRAVLGGTRLRCDPVYDAQRASRGNDAERSKSA